MDAEEGDGTKLMPYMRFAALEAARETTPQRLARQTQERNYGKIDWTTDYTSGEAHEQVQEYCALLRADPRASTPGTVPNRHDSDSNVRMFLGHLKADIQNTTKWDQAKVARDATVVVVEREHGRSVREALSLARVSSRQQSRGGSAGSGGSSRGQSRDGAFWPASWLSKPLSRGGATPRGGDGSAPRGSTKTPAVNDGVAPRSTSSLTLRL
ncbi:hypothetical protein M885DRAFT_269548 [Pelagophyceae sp. CCMP2097]|nr:hypothetical protein M885DRAFT_269548 [Pelagophyceae sp. CCMP2097]